MRWRVAALCAVFATAAGLALADVNVGEVREAQARSGVPVREAPKALAKVVATLPYRARVTVAEVNGLFARVTGDGNVAGWVRTSDIVLPGTLTGPGVNPGPGGAGSSSDVSAAGRQFDAELEKQFRASQAGLDSAFAALDALEAKTPAPGSPQTQAFIVEGRLGR